MVKTTFDFLYVNVMHSSKDDNLCNVAVTYNDSDWKVTEVSLNSSMDEVSHILKNALFNSRWEDEYTISPQTKIVSTIIDTFNLNDLGYFVLRNTLYQEDEEGRAFDELTGLTELKTLSIIFDEDGDVDKLLLTTCEGQFVLDEDRTKFEPAQKCGKYKSY